MNKLEFSGPICCLPLLVVRYAGLGEKRIADKYDELFEKGRQPSLRSNRSLNMFDAAVDNGPFGCCCVSEYWVCGDDGEFTYR